MRSWTNVHEETEQMFIIGPETLACQTRQMSSAGRTNLPDQPRQMSLTSPDKCPRPAPTNVPDQPRQMSLIRPDKCPRSAPTNVPDQPWQMSPHFRKTLQPFSTIWISRLIRSGTIAHKPTQKQEVPQTQLWSLPTPFPSSSTIEPPPAHPSFHPSKLKLVEWRVGSIGRLMDWIAFICCQYYDQRLLQYNLSYLKFSASNFE